MCGALCFKEEIWVRSEGVLHASLAEHWFDFLLLLLFHMLSCTLKTAFICLIYQITSYFSLFNHFPFTVDLSRNNTGTKMLLFAFLFFVGMLFFCRNAFSYASSHSSVSLNFTKFIFWVRVPASLNQDCEELLYLNNKHCSCTSALCFLEDFAEGQLNTELDFLCCEIGCLIPFF